MFEQTKTGFQVVTLKSLIIKVGMTGFEPATSCTPCKHATELRHIP